jgi:hypothetical protein
VTEARITANGYRPEDGLALEVKYVGSPDTSPFVPGSRVPDFIRRAVLEDLDSGLAHYGALMRDSTVPSGASRSSPTAKRRLLC